MRELWRRWRNVRWQVRYSVCGFVLIVGFYSLEYLRGYYAWKNYRAAAEARGERFEIEELMPAISPDNDNFEASAFFQKLSEADQSEFPIDFDNLPGINGWIPAAREAGYVGKPLGQSFPLEALFSENAEGLSRQQAAERLLEQLAQWDGILDECADAVRRPGRAPMEIDQEITDLYNDNSSYMDFLETARVLKLRSRARLEIDSPGRAHQDLMTLLDLSRQLAQGGSRIGVDVGTVVLSETEQVIWEGLRGRHWDRRELKELLSGLEEVSVIEGMALAIRMDRARCLRVLGLLAEGPIARFKVNGEWLFIFVAKEFAELYLPEPVVEPAGMIDSLILALVPGGWVKLNMRRFCRLNDLQLAALVERNPHLRAKNRGEFDAEIARSWWPRDGLLDHLVIDPADFDRSFWQIECRFSLARIAVALEIYRIDHGQYPATLEQLVPEHLRAILDPFSGGPFRYEIKPDGTPRIYSFGCNLQDDGGYPHQNSDQGDIVWQYTIPEFFTIDDYRD